MLDKWKHLTQIYVCHILFGYISSNFFRQKLFSKFFYLKAIK